MKRVLMVAALMCCMCSAAFSQKAEIFGGYSWARQSGSNLNKGWVGSVTGNFNRWFGIEGDVNGQYYNENVAGVVNGTVVTGTGNITVLTFRAGPRFAFRVEGSPVTPFAHLLFGLAHTTVTDSANMSGLNLSASASGNGFGGLAGGGIDIGKGPVAFRTEVDYNLLNVSNLVGFSDNSNGVRVSAGVVFRIP